MAGNKVQKLAQIMRVLPRLNKHLYGLPLGAGQGF